MHIHNVNTYSSNQPCSISSHDVTRYTPPQNAVIMILKQINTYVCEGSARLAAEANREAYNNAMLLATAVKRGAIL